MTRRLPALLSALALAACARHHAKTAALAMDEGFLTAPGGFEPDPADGPEGPGRLIMLPMGPLPQPQSPPGPPAPPRGLGRRSTSSLVRGPSREEPAMEAPLMERSADGPPARQTHAPGERPDSERLARPDPAPRYLSPAPLKDQPLPDRGASAPGGTEIGSGSAPLEEGSVPALPPSAMPTIAPAPAPDVALADLSAGSLRIQVSAVNDFSLLFLDKVYPFADRSDLFHDLAEAGAGTGLYWVRIAYVDLLDFQHPFSLARRYRFRLSR